MFLQREDQRMPLNIKDEAVHAKAKRLAELTGASITGAVGDAIARRLAEVERTQEADRIRRLRAMEEVARRFSAGLRPGHGATSTDHADLLYDEDGLPK
jgi:antitoxin VapB